MTLNRPGRQAEALSVFHDTRRVLDAELGIGPGPELRRLHERVLAADPGLDPPAEVVAGEGVQQGLQLGEVSGLGWLGGQPFRQGLPQPLRFP